APFLSARVVRKSVPAIVEIKIKCRRSAHSLHRSHYRRAIPAPGPAPQFAGWSVSISSRKIRAIIIPPAAPRLQRVCLGRRVSASRFFRGRRSKKSGSRNQGQSGQSRFLERIIEDEGSVKRRGRPPRAAD